MDVLARLDEARGAISVLEHPFYQRWSAGELSARELGVYAGEYRHAVLALEQHRRRRLRRRGRQSLRPAPPRRGGDGDVELWERFARATGARGAAPNASGRWARRRRACARGRPARTCSSTWRCCTRSRPSQPEISRTKLEGLTAHYGYSEEGPAVEYFRVHELRDSSTRGRRAS